MEVCTVCPHQNDCLNTGACLDELNAPRIAANQFPQRMTPAQANRFMEALRAGRTLRRICGGGSLGPPIASLDKFRKHCSLYPEWGAIASRLARINAKASDSLKAWRKGKYAPFCKSGRHAMVGDNVVTSKVCDSRYCKACWLERSQRPMTAEEITATKDALSKGWTTRKITEGIPIGGGPRDRNVVIVSRKAFFAQRKHDPEFALFVKHATAGNTKRGQQIRHSRIHTVAARDSNNDYYKIRDMIPERNPHRDDIVARIFEDILNSSLRREDVPSRIDHYVSEMNRLYPTKFAKFGDSPLVSLDEVMFDEGTATRGDTVSRSLWD
jgi:hypothetical protein